MENELRRSETIRISAEALQRLAQIRQGFTEQGLDISKVDKRIPLKTRVVDNIGFLNDVIAAALESFQQMTGDGVQITSSEARDFFREWIYVPNLVFTQDGLRYSSPTYNWGVTAENFDVFWTDGKARRHLTRLGNMSQDKLLKKAEREVRQYIL